MKLYIKKEHFKLVVLDLDGTFYSSQVYQKPYIEFAVNFITKNSEMSPAEIEHLIKNSGTDISVTDKIHSIGICKSKWNEARDKGFDITDHLELDEALTKSILKVCKHFKTEILTNNTRKSSKRIFKKLGFSFRDFSYVQTSDDSNFTKPSSDVFRKTAEKLNVNYDEILSIGDRYEIDIAPVLELGGSGVLVDGPGELIKYINEKLFFTGH